MATKSERKEDVKREWHLVDAENKVVGRLASELARILMGKHKPSFTPHVDTGDFVVVVNAEKIKFTGGKENKKVYYRHTGWVGGLVEEKVADVREKFPERILERAVKGMLPKNPLGRAMFQKLKVYSGSEHPHQAQQCAELSL